MKLNVVRSACPCIQIPFNFWSDYSSHTYLLFSDLFLEEVFCDVQRQDISDKFEVVSSQAFHLLLFFSGLGIGKHDFTKTSTCNIQIFLTAVKMENFHFKIFDTFSWFQPSVEDNRL